MDLSNMTHCKAHMMYNTLQEIKEAECTGPNQLNLLNLIRDLHRRPCID